MKQFRFQVLALGALVVVGQAQAVNLSNIDVNALMSEASKIQNELGSIVPVFNEIVTMVDNQKWDDLSNLLKTRAASLNLGPAIMNLQQYLDPAKSIIKEAVDYLSSQVGSLPAAYQGPAKSAISTIKDNLYLIDTIKNNLGTVADQVNFANLSKAADEIVKGAKAASNDEGFKNNLAKFRSNVSKAYDTVVGTDFASIPAAVRVGIARTQNPEISLADAEILAKGTTEVRYLIQSLVVILVQFTKFVVRTNKHVMKHAQLPADVSNALGVVNQKAPDFVKVLQQVNPEIDKALAELGL